MDFGINRTIRVKNSLPSSQRLVLSILYGDRGELSYLPGCDIGDNELHMAVQTHFCQSFTTTTTSSAVNAPPPKTSDAFRAQVWLPDVEAIKATVSSPFPISIASLTD